VPHVHAFRPTDPHPLGKRLVDVPEERQPRLVGLDRFEQRFTAPLEAPRDRVVHKLGDRRRDVGTKDVDLAECGHLGGVNLLVHLGRRAMWRGQPTADEPEDEAGQLDRLAVKQMQAVAQEFRIEARQIDIPVGQVCRRRHCREDPAVLVSHSVYGSRLEVAVDSFELLAYKVPCRREATRISKIYPVGDRISAEQLAKNSAGVIHIVDEQGEVA
jgi:hypothetical protein